MDYSIILQKSGIKNLNMSQNQLSFQAHNRPSNQQLKTMIHSMKIPYLNKIDQAKQKFSQHAIQFRKQEEKNTTNEIIKQQTHPLTKPTIPSSQTESKQLIENKREVVIANRQPHLGEWVMGQTKASIFNNMSQITQHYSRMFDKKVMFCKARNKQNNSFVEQEKTVIQRIFGEISNNDQQTVDFDKIIQFFQHCTLFYTIYNIHPASLSKIIRDSSHHYQSKLTKSQFLDLFLINNRSNKDYQNFNIQKIQKKCVLDEQQWKDIKQVFIQFDTFGNQTIQLKQLMNKLRMSVQHKYMLDWQVLNYQSINRTYTLNKILFQLQNKLNIGERYYKWQELQQLIINFQHIKEPTIDTIQQQKIKNGQIGKLNNNLMLKKQVLDFIKQIYMRCPKYFDNFVKINQFCAEIYQAQKSKVYLGEIVRNIPEVVTLKQVLTSMSKDMYEYMDLDEIIQQFSLKTPIKHNINKNRAQLVQNEQSQNDDDDELQNRIRQKQLNRKICDKILKKNSSKALFKKENTIAQEFNLSKKTKKTIRQRKLNQILQSKTKKQEQQCKYKFKAHPIPSSTNLQTYEQYKKKLAQNKQSIKKQLKKVTQQDKLLIKYLQVNTKLFQQPKKPESTCTSPTSHTFQHKSVPWFVHTNLLQKIQNEKQQKSKQIHKQTNIKYIKQWKNLPFCVQSPISSMDILPKPQTQPNQQQKNENSQQRSNSKVKQVPNFDLLHKQFEQQLHHKKMMTKPTKILQFKLTSPKQKDTAIIQQTTAYVSPNNSETKTIKQQSHNYIGSTIKYESMVRMNHEKKLMQQLHQQQIQQQQRRRQNNRKMFAKLLRKQLKKHNISSANHNTHRNKKSRANSQANHKQLAQMYQRVFARPFLFQQSSQNTHKFQQRASRVKLTNQPQPVDKFMGDVQQGQPLFYGEIRVEREQIISRQSI